MSIKNIFFLSIFLMLSACQSETVATKSATEDPIITPQSTISPIIEEESLSQGNTIRLAWFYKPPEDGTSLNVLAQNFDTFILTHYDEEERDELRALGVEAPFLEYLLFMQIQDPGSCSEEPYGNQVAYKTGDFCTLSTEHPDWFLRDKNGEMIRKGKKVFMDPGNLEYREFWLNRAIELQDEYGWDGVFIDNVEASLNKFKRLGQLPAKYPNDESYQAEIESFLAYIYNQYFRAEQRPVYANIIEYDDGSVWLRYMNYLDGAMIEDFAVDYGYRYYSNSYWETQINMSKEAQAMGKSLILVSQGEMEDTDRARFSFVSYLLISSNMTSFRYTESDYYEEVWLYENYFLELGSPINTLYQSDSGWRRDFTNGYVFLNPKSHQSEIHIEK